MSRAVRVVSLAALLWVGWLAIQTAIAVHTGLQRIEAVLP